MSLKLLEKTRWLALASMLALATGATAGCAADGAAVALAGRGVAVGFRRATVWCRHVGKSISLTGRSANL